MNFSIKQALLFLIERWEASERTNTDHLIVSLAQNIEELTTVIEHIEQSQIHHSKMFAGALLYNLRHTLKLIQSKLTKTSPELDRLLTRINSEQQLLKDGAFTTADQFKQALLSKTDEEIQLICEYANYGYNKYIPDLWIKVLLEYQGIEPSIFRFIINNSDIIMRLGRLSQDDKKSLHRILLEQVKTMPESEFVMLLINSDQQLEKLSSEWIKAISASNHLSILLICTCIKDIHIKHWIKNLPENQKPFVENLEKDMQKLISSEHEMLQFLFDFARKSLNLPTAWKEAILNSASLSPKLLLEALDNGSPFAWIEELPLEKRKAHYQRFFNYINTLGENDLATLTEKIVWMSEEIPDAPIVFLFTKISPEILSNLLAEMDEDEDDDDDEKDNAKNNEFSKNIPRLINLIPNNRPELIEPLTSYRNSHQEELTSEENTEIAAALNQKIEAIENQQSSQGTKRLRDNNESNSNSEDEDNMSDDNEDAEEESPAKRRRTA